MQKRIRINDNFIVDSGDLIGKGSTGNVYRGWDINNQKKKYAVKAIDLSQITNQVTQYLLSCQIVALTELSKLNVTSIVKLENVAFLDGYCYLVMELLEGGPLADYIKQNPNGINERQTLQLFKQIFAGYKALKNQGIVHRDIKPDNLIFRQKPHIYQESRSSKKLCMIDFGYCTKESVPNRPKVYYNVGSPKYMSPQAFRENIYSQKSDIWALGVILYEMLHGRTIDAMMDMDEYFQFMEENKLSIVINISQPLKNLLIGMLAFNYQNRHSCDDIQQALNQIENSHLQIPQLNFRNNGMDRRNSMFYRSEIMSHRSQPSQLSSLSPQHHQGSLIGNWQYHNNSFQPPHWNQSPNRNIHIESYQQKRNLMMKVSNLSDVNQIRNIGLKFPSMAAHQIKHFINGTEMMPLQKIEQEQNENKTSKQHFFKNSSLKNLKEQYSGNNREFLKVRFNNSPHQEIRYAGSDIARNQEMRLLNNPNILGLHQPLMQNKVKPYPQLVQSAIFNHEPLSNFNPASSFQSRLDSFVHHNPLSGVQPSSAGNVQHSPQKMFKHHEYFKSQVTENTYYNVNEVRSDKLILNKDMNFKGNDFMHKNLNKSFSTKDVENHTQLKLNNVTTFSTNIQPSLHHIPMTQPSSNQQILINNQRSNLAQLRSTLPSNMTNVYQPAIQNFNQNVNQNQSQYQQRMLNEDSLTNTKHYEKSVEKYPHQTQCNTHNKYFTSNFTTNKDQKMIQNSPTTSDFNIERPFHEQNRTEKSNSFRIMHGTPNHTINQIFLQLPREQNTSQNQMINQPHNITVNYNQVSLQQGQINFPHQNQIKNAKIERINPQYLIGNVQNHFVVSQNQLSNHNQLNNFQSQYVNAKKMNPQTRKYPYDHEIKKVVVNQQPLGQHIYAQNLNNHPPSQLPGVQHVQSQKNNSSMIAEKSFYPLSQNQNFNPKGSFIIENKQNNHIANQSNNNGNHHQIFNNLPVHNRNIGINQHFPHFNTPPITFPNQNFNRQPFAVGYH